MALDYPVLARRSQPRFWRSWRRLWRHWRRARSRADREGQAGALSPRQATDIGIVARPGALERWAAALLQHQS